jgi:hypothetical protein
MTLGQTLKTPFPGQLLKLLVTGLAENVFGGGTGEVCCCQICRNWRKLKPDI